MIITMPLTRLSFSMLTLYNKVGKAASPTLASGEHLGVDTLAASLTKMLEALAGDRFYDNPQLPCDADRAVMEVVDGFTKATPAEREQFIEAVPNKDAGFFLSFAVRMATLGVREKSVTRVRQGLIAVVIENFRRDSREDLMTLAPLNDAAGRVGADPVDLFDEAASYATPDVAEKLKTFVRRHPDLKSLRVMGFSAQDTPQGFQYVFRWPA